MKRVLHKSRFTRGLADLLDSFAHRRIDALKDRLYAQRGHQMAVFANDHIGAAIEVFGVFEKSDLDLLFSFLAPLRGRMGVGLALDIGANIGNHTIYFSKLFSKIYAYEPNPSAFKLLDFNLSSLPHASAFNIGLGDEAGQFSVVEPETNVGGAHIVGDHSSGCIKVHVKRLDDLDIDMTSLCFIKIDVEGFEPAVIRGGIETIQKYEPIIVFEQLASAFTDNVSESIQMLLELNYRFCWSERRRLPRSWLLRRATNIKEMLFGGEQTIVSCEAIPPRNYDMLIGIPRKFQAELGF